MRSKCAEKHSFYGAQNAKQHPKEPMKCLKKEISGLCVSLKGGGARPGRHFRPHCGPIRSTHNSWVSLVTSAFNVSFPFTSSQTSFAISAHNYLQHCGYQRRRAVVISPMTSVIAHYAIMIEFRGSVFGMSIVSFASAFRCTLHTFQGEA